MNPFDDSGPDENFPEFSSRYGPRGRNRVALAAPAGSPLAAARIAAHAAFDPLWKSGAMSRTAAYNWLAQKMGLPVRSTHMVLFNEEQCRAVVEICNADARCRRAAISHIANDFEDLTK